MGISRDAIYKYLYDHNVFVRKYFYPLTSEFDCYAGVKSGGETPVAKKASMQVLTLPFYADIDEETIEYICGLIKEMI